VTTLSARSVIAEKQSERNAEPSFPRIETDVFACTIQRKNINATGAFFLKREFKTTPQFLKSKNKKNSSYIRANTVLQKRPSIIAFLNKENSEKKSTTFFCYWCNTLHTMCPWQ
jgi:hypothetical protein